MPLVDPPLATLTARMEPGRRAFDRGQFFEAHELWEEVWRELEGEPRRLVQGLIQIAAGLHHRRRGRERPAARLVTKGLEKLGGGAPALRAALRIDALVAALAQTGRPKEEPQR
jgi:predicted metal-dependent hydrolase